ncbi:MAG: hypothetical protein HYR96_00130 [Deltaproteobacteria bacterium]|nr:hypothetical protein [Deltaproteobacteria bacterium]
MGLLRRQLGPFFLATAILTVGCNRHIDKLTSQAGHQTWFQKIQSDVLNRSCVGCHKGPSAKAGVQPDTYDHVRFGTLKDGTTPLITPGDCDNSGLALILRMNFMPPPDLNKPLDVASKKMIENWIDAGADKDALAPGTEVPTPPTPVEPPKPPVSENDSRATYKFLAEKVFKDCRFCHSGPDAQNGLDFTDYNSLIASKKIVKGVPTESPLYQRLLQGGDDPMPPDGQLSPDTLKLIHNWILSGAKDN